jgi:hypothetical protein
MKENEVIIKFVPDARMQALIDKRLQLVVEKKRDFYCDNAEFLVYHWSGQTATFSPATGEHACGVDKIVLIKKIAIRKNEWKLIFRGNQSTAKNELCNLKTDLGETNNLIEKYPEIEKGLTMLLNRIKRQGFSNINIPDEK